MLLAVVALIFFASGYARAQEIETPFIAIDRASGAVLLEQKAFDQWYPASLTKLMTVLVALRAIEAGEIQPGSPVVISGKAAAQPPSKMGYRTGTRLRLDTALNILVVKSANDVAVAVAEAVAGNTAGFVERMNGEAARLGMRDSRFVNPHGLHDAGQVVNARDMAVLARELLQNFPDFADIFAVPALRSGETIHHSYNLLLERFDGADGMKTGFVCASGYNMVASATREGRQIIAVVLGTFSQTDRAVAAAKLISDAFGQESGIPISQYRPIGAPKQAQSQRPRMCSEEARSSRYDPGAGDAVIDSPLLSPRRQVREPLPVSVGGIDAPPSDALLYARYMPTGSVPVPEPRPEFVRRDIDGLAVAAEIPSIGNIPVPVPRPEALTQ